MLKHLASGIEQVYSAAGSVLSAMQEIALADSPAVILEVLRKQILSDAIDRVSLIQIGFGPSGEPVTEKVALFDANGLAPKDELPDALRQHIGKKPLIVPDVSKLDHSAEQVKEYAQTLQAQSLAIFPLIGRDRTAGFLLLASRRPYEYTEREIEVMASLAAQSAIALDNLSLLNAVARKTESLDLANRIARQLAGKLDMDALGSVLASSLSRIPTIQHVSVMLYEAGQLNARTYSFLGKPLPETVNLSGSILQQALDAQHVIQSADPASLPDAEVWRSIGVRSLIVVPLVGTDRKLGTLNIGTAESASALTEQAAMLEQTAGQIASALENIHLFDRLQTSLDETSALYSTALAMNAAETLEEAYETALGEMARFSGADQIRIYLAGPDPRTSVSYIETVARWDDSALQTAPRPRYSITEAPVLSQFPQSRANLMFNDIKTDRRLDDALRAELSGRGVNALMLIPLSTGMTWLGALLLEATSGQTFTGDQARLCRNIADQAALVVDSQLLLFRAQQAAEREHALRDTAAALSSTLDPDTLLGVVLDNLGRVLPHDAANLLIMDGDFARPRLIRGYAEQGIDEDIVMQFRVPIQYADNLRRMRDERQPFIIADTRTYPGWVDNEVTHWVRSYAGAPVFVGDTLLGFISLDSATPGLYTEEHSALLQTFADQAAIAIQNAQRYEETQRRIQHEQMVGEIAAELQHAHTIEAVLETAARSLQQTLGNYDVAVRLTGEPERQSLPETTEASNAN